MATFNDLSTYIQNATSMDDTVLVALINPAINFGVWLATALYEPRVQLQISDLTAVNTAGYIDISSMTRLMRFIPCLT